VQRRYLVFLIQIICITFLADVRADSMYKEINIIGGYSDRDKWVGKSESLSNSVGFENYRKFSNEYGDFLTSDLQLRLAYDSLKNSEEAWAVQIHNAWVAYKLGLGRDLKIGHFDPAFGLEPILDTHGTILQTLAMKNIGFNKDWGFALEGSLSELDYKLALQLGSGMSIRHRDGSYLFTTRMGTPATRNFQYGVSLMHGEVLRSEGMQTFPLNDLLSDKAVRKDRIGIDSQYLFSSYLFKGEIAYGKNDSDDVLGYLGEIDYTLPKNQNIQLELQFQSWVNDLAKSKTDDSTIIGGVSYKLNQNITLRAALSHDFNLMEGREDDKILVQFYYFGI